MGDWTKARIQLCGRFVADIDGSRLEDVLPRPQGADEVRPIWSSGAAIHRPAMSC
jgi:hypothetical protein